MENKKEDSVTNGLYGNPRFIGPTQEGINYLESFDNADIQQALTSSDGMNTIRKRVDSAEFMAVFMVGTHLQVHTSDSIESLAILQYRSTGNINQPNKEMDNE